ncbi:hypothetical protein FS749_002259 [Ceratobasidium sp. UAMH 11750]|nr:hypothetical protein FS749_002259 [Ceratobasidium sp. UAMH 11750]
MTWSPTHPEWDAFAKDVRLKIEERITFLKKESQRGQDWLSKPANRNWLIVKGVKYAVFSVVFGGTLVLVLGPQGAAISAAWVVGWKLVEKLAVDFELPEKLAKIFSPITQKLTEYLKSILPKGWSEHSAWLGRWAWWGVRVVALGPTGLLWMAAEWFADGVSMGVQKIMEWFGAEFEKPKLD